MMVKKIAAVALEIEIERGREDFDCLVDYISGLEIKDEHYKLLRFRIGEKNFVGVEVDEELPFEAPLCYFQLATSK